MRVEIWQLEAACDDVGRKFGGAELQAGWFGGQSGGARM
jgi:hypothetical protein